MTDRKAHLNPFLVAVQYQPNTFEKLDYVVIDSSETFEVTRRYGIAYSSSNPYGQVPIGQLEGNVYKVGKIKKDIYDGKISYDIWRTVKVSWMDKWQEELVKDVPQRFLSKATHEEYNEANGWT